MRKSSDPIDSQSKLHALNSMDKLKKGECDSNRDSAALLTAVGEYTKKRPR